MRTLLVTGGAGFIGGNFIHYMLDAYDDIRLACLDALTYAGNMSTLASVIDDPRLTFYKGDISSQQAVDDLFQKYRFDVVVNFAAETHVDRSIENPSIFLMSNVVGTQVLMDACLKYNALRFHQISTDEVYGDLPLDRPDLKFRENYPVKASSPYAASKASADLLVMAYIRTFGLPATISRCSNNYGPYQYPDKLIPLMTILAMAGESLPLYGDGKNVRDWLHVSDHCAAVDAILRRGTVGEIYNIGGNCEKANVEVACAILAVAGKDERLISFVKDRPGHDLRYAVDSSKLTSETGWMPQIDFDQGGIQETVSWYANNKDWWKPLMKDSRRYGI